MHLCSLGAETVVLAFDDGTHVPRAKAITQRKRREKVSALEIEGWPDTPPQPWNAAMANSAFKQTVIRYVAEHLPALLQLRRKNVIIDWNGDHYQHVCYVEPNDWWVEDVAREARLGEADVKFLYWARVLARPMAVISVDGDYVPIAMSLDTPVAVFRHAWIDVGLLRSHLRLPLRELVVLMALTGTDYSRQLPWIKPKHLYFNVCFFSGLLQQVVLSDTAELDEDVGMRLIAAIYELKFRKFNVSKLSFASARSSLLKSKLSDRIKERLPSEAQARCTLRNAKFLLAYWRQYTFDASDLTAFGFREHQGLVVWDDSV